MKPWRCPHCRSRSGVPVQYGLPTRQATEAAARGELVLGGCVLGDDDPPRCCLECRAALWRGAVFAVPGAADDRRIVLRRGLGPGRLEASVSDDYSLTVSWEDPAGPAEPPVRVAGEDVDLLVMVLALHLASDGARLGRWLRQRGLGFVGELEGPVDRLALTSDDMLSFTGPGGDLLVHASVQRFLLQATRAAFRHQGFGSIAEFRDWLASVGLDVVRSG